MRARRDMAGWGVGVFALAAIGCGDARFSSGPAADGGEQLDPVSAATPAADGGGSSRDAAAPTARGPATGLDVAPDQPSYEVPVSSDALKPYATFAVDSVSWRVQADKVRLAYDFPAALSGRAQRVDFSGNVDAPGHATLSSDVGSAQCTFTSAAVHCDEMLPGLKIDSELARSMVSGLSTTDVDMRLAVVESFSGDPIGVLRFAPEPNDAANGGGRKK